MKISLNRINPDELTGSVSISNYRNDYQRIKRLVENNIEKLTDGSITRSAIIGGYKLSTLMTATGPYLSEMVLSAKTNREISRGDKLAYMDFKANLYTSGEANQEAVIDRTTRFLNLPVSPTGFKQEEKNYFMDAIAQRLLYYLGSEIKARRSTIYLKVMEMHTDGNFTESDKKYFMDAFGRALAVYQEANRRKIKINSIGDFQKIARGIKKDEAERNAIKLRKEALIKSFSKDFILLKSSFENIGKSSGNSINNSEQAEKIRKEASSKILSFDSEKLVRETLSRSVDLSKAKNLDEKIEILKKQQEEIQKFNKNVGEINENIAETNEKIKESNSLREAAFLDLKNSKNSLIIAERAHEDVINLVNEAAKNISLYGVERAENLRFTKAEIEQATGNKTFASMFTNDPVSISDLTQAASTYYVGGLKFYNTTKKSFTEIPEDIKPIDLIESIDEKQITDQLNKELENKIKHQVFQRLSGFSNNQRSFEEGIYGVGTSIAQHNSTLAAANDAVNNLREKLDSERDKLDAEFNPEGDTSEAKLKSVQDRKVEIQSLNARISNFNTRKDAIAENTSKKLAAKKSEAGSLLTEAKKKLQDMQQVQQDINGIVEGLADGREASSITFTQQELNKMGFSVKNDMTLADLQDLVENAVLSATAKLNKAKESLEGLNSKFTIAKVEPLSGERVKGIANLEVQLRKRIALEKQREYERQLKEDLQLKLNGLGTAVETFSKEINATDDSINQHSSGIGKAKENIANKKKGLEDRKSELGANFKLIGDSTQKKLDSVQQQMKKIASLNVEIESFNNTEGLAIATEAKNAAKTKRKEAKRLLDMANFQLEKIQRIQEAVDEAVKSLKSETKPDSIKFTMEELARMGLTDVGEMTLKQLQERVSSECSKARERYNEANKRVGGLKDNENSIVAGGVEALKVDALEKNRVELEAQLQKEQAIETARTAMLSSIAEQFTKARESSQNLERNLNTIKIQSNKFKNLSRSAEGQRTEANSIIASVKKEVGELPKVPAGEPEQTTQSKIEAVSKRIEEIKQKVAAVTKGVEANNTKIFKLKQSAKSTVTDSEKILSEAKEEFKKAKQAQTQLTGIIGTFKQSLGKAELNDAEINSFSLTKEQLRQAVGNDNFDLFNNVGESITIQDLTTTMENIVAAAEQNFNTASQNVALIKSRLETEFGGVSPKGINIDTTDLSQELNALKTQNENERKKAAADLAALIKDQASVFLSVNRGVVLAENKFLKEKFKALLEARNARTSVDAKVIDVGGRRKKLLENEEIPDEEMDEQKRQRITKRKGDIEKLRSDIDELRESIDQANLILGIQLSLVDGVKSNTEAELKAAEAQLKEITRTAGEIRTLAEQYMKLYGNGATIERGVVAELSSGFEFNLLDGEGPIPVDDLLNNFNTFQHEIEKNISSLREELGKEDIVFNQIEQIPEFDQKLDAQITKIQQVLKKGSAIPRDSGPENDDLISLSVAPQNQNTRAKNTPIGGDSGSIMGGAILEGANDGLLHMLSGDNLGMFSEILDKVSQLGDRESMRKGMLNNAAFGQLASKYSDASKGMFVGAGKDGNGGYVIQAAALGDFDITKEPIEITMTLGKDTNVRSFAWLMPQEELYVVDKDGNKVGKPMKFEEAQKALGEKISLPRNQDVIQQTEFRSLANQQIENPQPEHQPQQNTSSQGAPSVDSASNDSLKQELETYLKGLVSDPNPEIVINPQLFSDISRAYSELQEAVHGLDLTLKQIVEYSLPKDAAERSSIILDEDATRMSNAILKGFGEIKSMGENGKTAADIRAVVVKSKDDVLRGQ